MGSTGVSVSTGRLIGRQISDLLEGRINLGGGKMPDFIRVYPNNNRDSDLAGFIIRMEDVNDADRQKFLRLWKRQSNVDNGDRSAQKAEKLALRAGASAEDAKIIGEEARTRTTMNAMRGLLDRDSQSNNPRFTGITLDNIKRKRNKRKVQGGKRNG